MVGSVGYRRGLAVVGVVVAALAGPAAAEQKTWTGVAGSWTDGNNWSPAAQPGANDDVVIASGSADLAVDTVVASLTLSGGTLAGSGRLTVTGPVSWTAGTMSGSGTTLAMAGMDLGGANKTLNERMVVLSGGTATMNASGSFISMRNGATFINQATLELSNDGGLINNQGFFNGGSGGGSFNNHGTLRKLAAGNSGITRFAGVTVDNTGIVEVLGATLSFSGGYTQTAGVTRLNGGTLGSETALMIDGGLLEGIGTVEASVASDGDLGPGLSAGALRITGTHTQTSGGTLTVEIGGPTAGTEFDQLNIDGAATLSGTLDVRLLDGFVPTLGQSFEIMTFASRTGTFSTVNGLAIDGGLAFEPRYGATNLVLAVVPVGLEPTVTPSPTATPNGSTCAGDCDGDREVRIQELIVAVRIALGEEALGRCLPADTDGDETVAVNELIQAVTRALGGCP
jgi:hypothetical protein